MNVQMNQIVFLCAASFDSGMKPSDGKIHPENYFHGLTTGLLVSLLGKYLLTSNRESGWGRYDLCLEPIDRKHNPNAYILEFKVFDDARGDTTLQDTAYRAKQQIEEKQYDAQLLAKGFEKSHIIIYGFGFRGKEVVII